MPTPTSQPLLLLLEPVIDAPVVTLVIAKSSLPTPADLERRRCSPSGHPAAALGSR
jgi:hypothetical protein